MSTINLPPSSLTPAAISLLPVGANLVFALRPHSFVAQASRLCSSIGKLNKYSRAGLQRRERVHLSKGHISNSGWHGYISQGSHVLNYPDPILQPCSLLRDHVADWGKFLSEGVGETHQKLFQRHEQTGRPLGNQGFLAQLEKKVKRPLQKQRPGPKAKGN